MANNFEGCYFLIFSWLAWQLQKLNIPSPKSNTSMVNTQMETIETWDKGHGQIHRRSTANFS